MQRRLAVVFLLGTATILFSTVSEAQMQIYGSWHCGNDFCTWATARDTSPGGDFDTANHWMIDRGDDFLLVDVREPAEYDIVKVPGSVLIPKGDIPGKLSELPLNKPIVLYCKSGVRSAEALATLKNAGFATATHMQGGVLSWIRQVDPSLPVY